MSAHCAFQDFVMEEGNSEKLKQFLITGRVKIEGWDENAFSQLEKELLKGEASLHLDGQGTAVRVVSVAKPVIYDPEDHTVLIEAFQSFGPKKTKVKCSGMSEKFNPREESCQAACKRAIEEELKISVNVSELCQNSQLVKTLAPSQKFAGLKSEYHLWYCMLSQQAVKYLQTKIPKMEMTGVDETDSTSNPKTLWWAWCPSLSVKEVHRHLTRLTESTPFAGKVDFTAELKLGTPGEQVREEAMMGKWWTAPAPQFERDLLFKPEGAVNSVKTMLPEGTTPQSRRLSECRTATMVESAPEPETGVGHRHRSGASNRTLALARSSRHSAVWSLRTLDDDRGPLLARKAQVLQSKGADDSASPVAGSDDMRRVRSEPEPSWGPVACCASGR